MGKKSNEVKKDRHINRPKDRNINNVQKQREKVFNDTDVNKTTVLPKLKCFYTNADQLFNKLPELMVRTRDNKPDIIGITEVKNKIQVSQSIRFEKLVNTKCLLKTLIGKKVEVFYDI